MNIKQVIVMRKNFVDQDGNSFQVRKGKMIAQGAHASLGVILDHFCKPSSSGYDLNFKGMDKWFSEGFTKVCLQVEDEAGLIAIFQAAKSAGLPVTMITDSGHTEFHGVPTKTCLAIGPAPSDKIDKITGSLKLL